MFDHVLTTQSELEHAWRELMGPWSFAGHSVWLMLVLDDRPVPPLIEIAEAADPPEDDQLSGLVDLLSTLERELAPGLRVAFLRSRPGKAAITDLDRVWATRLYAAARRAAVPCEVVHLATRGAIRPIPADVVGLRAR